MPLVSIIMPTYNSMRFLHEALDSLYAQTLTDWELIIVQEFNSSDGTPQYLAGLKDPRIKVLLCEQHMGISAALNMGIRAATGEFIARMDDDDICLPERLEKQVQYLRSHPAIGICGTQVDIFGDFSWHWPIHSDPQLNRAMMPFFQPVIHPTFMLRKQVLEDNNIWYNEDFNATEDYEILSRLNEVTGIGNVEEVLFRYRRHANVATSRQSNGVALSQQVQQSIFKQIGIELSPLELDIVCPHGSWRSTKDITAFNKSLSDLIRVLRKTIFTVYKHDWCDLNALISVFKRVYSEYIYGSSFSEKEKNKLLKSSESIFKSEISFYKFVYTDRQLDKIKSNVATPIPEVSIVLPTFNVSYDIERCLHSLLAQAFSNFEIIIVHDGDDALIREIIGELNDGRIRLMTSDRRLGLAESLNRGMRHARGAYIARADADDYYKLDRLAKQIAFLKNNPEISLCTSSQEHIDTYGQLIRVHRPATTHEQLKAQLLFQCDICHSSVVFKKDDFAQADLWYSPKFLMEDYELWSRAVFVLHFASIDQAFSRYQVHENSISLQRGFTALSASQAEIIKPCLERLDIQLAPEDEFLLQSWDNQYVPYSDPINIKRLDKLLVYLETVWTANKAAQIYDPDSLRIACEDHLYTKCPPEANSDIYYSSRFGTKEAAKRNQERKIREEELIREYREANEMAEAQLEDTPMQPPQKGVDMIKKIIKWILKPIVMPVINRIANKVSENLRPVIYEAVQSANIYPPVEIEKNYANAKRLVDEGSQQLTEWWLDNIIGATPAPPHTAHLSVSWPENSEYFKIVRSASRTAENLYAKSLLADIQQKDIPGSIIEFGVFQGDSLKQLAMACDELGLQRDILGLDSFEGLPEPNKKKDSDFWFKGQYCANYEDVYKRMDCEKNENVKLVKGWFANTLQSQEMQTVKEIAYARIDCDLYQPAVECLDYLTDRLVDGAVLVFDDWSWDPFFTAGEVRALQEWLPAAGLRLEFAAYCGYTHVYFRVKR